MPVAAFTAKKHHHSLPAMNNTTRRQMHVHEFSPQLPVNNQKYSKTPRRLSKDVCLRGPCYSPEYEQAQHHRQNFNDDDRLSALKCVGTCMQVLLNIIGVSS